MERWKDVPGYEGYYQVSNKGRVRSLGGYRRATNNSKQYFPGRIRKTTSHRLYPAVSLSVNRKIKTVYVHRLVAIAFIPNPDNKPHINHLDGDKQNSTVENLEWCTHSENMKHMYRTGLAKPVKSWLGKINNPDRSFPVYQYSLDGFLIKEWPSLREIRRRKGYHLNNITSCINGKYKQAYGFIWKLKNPTPVGGLPTNIKTKAA